MIKKFVHNNNHTIYTDEAIYYGMKIISFNILTIFSILFLGLITNNIFFSIIFLICFIPERLVIDGYHCKNILRCEIFFSVSYIIIWKINMMFEIEIYIVFLLLLTIFCMFVKYFFLKRMYFNQKELVMIIFHLILIVVGHHKVYIFKLLTSVLIFNILLKELKSLTYE